MKKNVLVKKLELALLKKATGYNVTESVKEYVVDPDDDNKKTLVRIKKKEKYVPPDAGALKALAELQSGKLIDGNTGEFESMSDKQLEAEKKRLIKMISDSLENDKGNE